MPDVADGREKDLRREIERLKKRLADLEAEYAARENRIRQIAENIGGWIWEVDTAGLYTYASPLVRGILGYYPEQLIGKKHFYDLFLPEERDRLKEAAFTAFSRHEAFKGFVNRNLTADGRVIWLATGGVPMLDQAGRLLGYRGLDVDMTELAEARETIRESEERYRRVTENGQYMVYRMALADGRYEYVSPASKEITGYTPEEFYGQPGLIQQRIHPDWRDYFAKEWRRLKQGEMPPFYEYRIVDKAGNDRWLHQRNTLICDGAGSPQAIEGIVSDITERKRAEEVLRESENRIRHQLNAILSPGEETLALRLGDIIDRDALQHMMEAFYRITGIPSAVLDVAGEVLVAVGWQDICTQFHRVHPGTRQNCLESDTQLTENLTPGMLKFYVCKNNLCDVASPIMLGGQHVGNVFIGQFFLEDTPLDYDLFRDQARRYGFDEEAYLAALDRVPRYSRERITAAMTFFGQFSEMLSALSYSNLRLARSLAEKDRVLQVLRAGEDRFRTLVENANDIIYSLTPEGVFTYVSPQWTKLLGHDPDEVLGKSFIPFVKEEDLPDCWAFLSQVLATGSCHGSREYRVRHKNGGWRWHASNASRAVDADGHEFYMAIARDITESKRTEAALLFLVQCGSARTDEDFFSSLTRYLANDLEMEYVCIARLSKDGSPARIVARHGRADAMEYVLHGSPLGAQPGEGVVFHPQDVRRRFPQDALLHALKAESYIGVYLWDLRGCPIGVMVAIGARPLQDAPIAASIFRLVAARAAGELERRQMEDALRSEKALTDAILDSAPGIIYVYDDQRRLVRWNKKHEEWTGYSAAELLGKDLMEWYTDDPESQAAVTAGLEETVKTGYGEAEAELQCKDGTRVPMYFTASPLIFNDRTYFVGIGMDITERRRAEEEKDRLQNQLLQAQKMEAVGQLAGGIAHDFNNLLQVILGNLSLAQGDLPADAPAHTELEEVQKAAQRAAELTGQLLAFGRRQIMKLQYLDLNDLVRGMLKMLCRVIGEHIDVCFIPGAPAGFVHADKVQLEQVLMNLCLNARDAMPRGGRLTLATGAGMLGPESRQDNPWAPDINYAMIRVADTGCGMDAATRAHIFEPFFTTKAVGRGSGLGLPMVYGIVKQHDGFVEVDSEAGKGTEFRVFLPLAQHTGAPAATPVGESPVAGGTETILVAEDEPAVLRLIAHMLRSAGYTVLTAHNGEEALRLFTDHAEAIRLVVLDVIMPGLSGREVMDRIRAQHHDVRFLFSSGYSENAIHTDFVIEQGLTLIQKPYKKESLLREVRQILDSKD